MDAKMTELPTLLIQHIILTLKIFVSNAVLRKQCGKIITINLIWRGNASKQYLLWYNFRRANTTMTH